MKNLGLDLKKKPTREQLLFALYRLHDAINEISTDLYEIPDPEVCEKLVFFSDIDEVVYNSLCKLQGDRDGYSLDHYFYR